MSSSVVKLIFFCAFYCERLNLSLCITKMSVCFCLSSFFYIFVAKSFIY